MKSDRWLWAILLLGATVRVVGLGERSLSYDECQQFWASRGSVLVSNRAITLDPPGFAWLLHLYGAPERSETWLRLVPCLFGVLAIAVVHRLAIAATGDRWTARAAAFFFALAPYPIRYSQSLRVYSQAMLFAALLVAVFLETEADEARGWRGAALLGVSAFAALLSLYGSVWLILPLALLLSRRGRRELGRRRRVAIGLGVGVALAAPWYLLSIPVQLSQGTPASFYEDKFMPPAPVAAARFLLEGTRDLFAYLSFIQPWTGLLFGTLAVLGMIGMRRQRRGADLVVVFLGSLGSSAIASGFRLYPFGGTRQMLFAAPLFTVLVASGIASLRGRLRGLPAAAILLGIAAGSGIFLVRYHTEPGGQEMRPVIRWLERNARAGDRILVNKDARPQFQFYYRGEPDRVVEGTVTVIGDYLGEANRLMAAAPTSRWWLVFSHGWQAARRGELAAIDPRFLPGSVFEAHQAAVYLFVPRGGGAGSPDNGPEP